ncbi:ATP-binding protein [Streptomyces sp. Marseille-Q5077]|uniref:ATP-binding protein n=1 Tax=Streptomyces sp. Marseille-Q5077 TaxID=3418995 RepID=UPI003D094632
MSTTRPFSPGDRGPEPSGASGASESGMPATGSSDEGSAAAGGPGGGTVPSLRPVESAEVSAGRQVRRLVLEGQSGVVPLARDFARQALYAWGWLPAATADQRAAAEDVLLVVSELVTNACLHADGPDELWIACDNKVIRVEVSDKGTGQPAPRTPHRAGRPGGHGMFIVQRLCLDWGVMRTPGVAGKTVWAELGAPA